MMSKYTGGRDIPIKPTADNVEHFLQCLRDVPPHYFSDYKDSMSADYGTCFTSYYLVTDWLRYDCIDRRSEHSEVIDAVIVVLSVAFLSFMIAVVFPHAG